MNFHTEQVTFERGFPTGHTAEDACDDADLNRGVIKVIYDVAKDVYVDLERKLAAALARD